MRKKLATVLSLYFAGMIMLAFVVFPHHHHNEFICFNISHCSHDSQNEQDKEHHDSDQNGCVDRLFQTHITKDSSRILTDNEEEGQIHHFTISFFTPAEILHLLPLGILEAPLPAAQDEILHQNPAVASPGTRAPPIA